MDPSAPAVAALGAAYQQTATAIQSLTQRQATSDRRAVERDQTQAARDERLTAALEACTEQLSSLADRVGVLAERQAEAERAAAVVAEEGASVLRAELADVAAAVVALAHAGPEWTAGLADAIRRQEEDAARFRRFAGRSLAELREGQAQAVESLRSELSGMLAAEGERAADRDREHAEQAAEFATVLRDGFTGASHERAESRMSLEGCRAEVRELRGALDSATVTGTAATDAARDAVLAAVEAQGDATGAAATAAADRLSRDIDQCGGMVAGVAAVVDRLGGDLGDVRQAVAVEAEAVRALVHGHAEETAAEIARLGKDQAAELGRLSEAVTGEATEIRRLAAEEAGALRAEARVREETTGRSLAGIAGDLEAITSLMVEVPAQVRESTTAAAAVVERTGAELAAHVESAGSAMTARTDRLIGLIAGAERARDEAVISLSRRVAVLGEQVPEARQAWERREAQADSVG
ncbi:hypothetical protein ACWC0C_29550 [Streptomyces sp. NPDC001709]